MKQVFVLLFFFFNSMAWAQIEKAPPSFDFELGRAIFIDIQSSRSRIVYDVSSRQVAAETTIEFKVVEEGFPVFDLVEDPSQIKLNGESVENLEITKYSKLRVLTTPVNVGTHRLVIHGSIRRNLRFENDGVSNAFWMSDLSSRSYLERYLPGNLEYDQYPSVWEVEILGSSKKHIVFTNGELSELGNNRFLIKLPRHFTASSPYFHIGPEEGFRSLSFSYKDIPVVIYSRSQEKDLEFVKKRTIEVLTELEADYGPWPHPSLTVYSTVRGGGMEYSGATLTSDWALPHELTHSYFARGVMPTNGDAGWMDEAIASWRDKGYRSQSQLPSRGGNLGNHSVYNRETDSRAYSYGRDFISFLHGQLSNIGGLKPFLRKLVENKLFDPIKTVEFQKALEEHSGRSWQAEFDHAIYGQGLQKRSFRHQGMQENPYHPKLTNEQMQAML